MPLIIGVTDGGVLVPVQVDANGVVIVDQVSALPAGTNNIGDVDVLTLPALPIGTNEIGKIQARNYGWIAAAWQKNPLGLGYSGDQTEQKSNLSASAGTNVLSGTAVPAGEIWVVEAASCGNNTKVSTRLNIVAIVNSVEVFLVDVVAGAVAIWATWSGAITLSEGDYIRGSFYSCALNDDLYLQYHARRIDIDQ